MVTMTREEIDWNNWFYGLTVEEMWQCFHSIYCKLLHKFIPSVTFEVRDLP